MSKITIDREVLELALEALESIALAGMSGSGQESEEGMRDWHARQAWKFIGNAARSLDSLREAMAQPQPVQQEPTLKVYKGEICYKSKDDDQSYGMWCPVTYDHQHGLPDGTQFYPSPQAAQPQTAQPLTPDMFWNSDDADEPHDSIGCFLNDQICQHDLEVGAVFTIWRAKKFPSMTIRVTAIDEEECEAEYEVIEQAHGITKGTT